MTTPRHHADLEPDEERLLARSAWWGCRCPGHGAGSFCRSPVKKSGSSMLTQSETRCLSSSPLGMSNVSPAWSSRVGSLVGSSYPRELSNQVGGFFFVSCSSGVRITGRGMSVFSPLGGGHELLLEIANLAKGGGVIVAGWRCPPHLLEQPEPCGARRTPEAGGKPGR